MAKKAMKKYSFYIDEKTLNHIKWRAKEENLSEAGFIREAVQKEIINHVIKLVESGKSLDATCTACGFKWVIDTDGSYDCPICGQQIKK